MEDTSFLMDDPEIVKEFLTESGDHLESVESQILQLEENPDNTDIINTIFRPIHSTKGSAGFLGLKDMGTVSHELETLLDEARKGNLKITPLIIEILYEGVDILKRLRGLVAKKVEKIDVSDEIVDYAPVIVKIKNALVGQKATESAPSKPQHLGEILVEKGEITEDDLDKALEEQEKLQQKKIGEIIVEKGIVTKETIDSALKTLPATAPVSETVKVDIQKIDSLVNLVGELVIANALIKDLLENTNSTSNKNISHLGKIVKDIQDQVMSIRMVPIKSTFQKMSRLVRDVSKKAGKKVKLEVSGEETELDKSVIESIGDPLVHILRNSVDHGIEPEEERIAAGKPALGHVYLDAFHKGGNIFIEIRDDGRGLRKDKLLKKAIEKGIMSENATLTEQQIFGLIFAAGFSTAEKITDISGRGVGMDVVKKNIERLRGKVEISSEEGKGTKISIKLPLTMAIIDGMIVQVGNQKYIVPMLSIEESIRPKKDDISTIQQRGEVINVRGNILPMVRLHQWYNVEPKKYAPWEAIILIVESEGQRCGILVDDLIGQQQIVIKRLGEQFRNVKGVSGSAILGDGRVGLILDVGGIMNLALN
ncbi:signal transduction histidine kinase CheA [Candidatus Kuenenia stuttgartiensis]|jgi:two-component system chemotaxis sensor kinase CheA|nr:MULTISPECIES: chemotaxis protein CheA [Kuenenia]MBE7547986.1 chemotaxis protein CheA [Planctomycetia bacterium]MBW7941566.1 chemotaxis protein CheA [Candidatus Kuenenia stuttgartiensis]MBZ0193164.1 chemotaxis protein CheA [Candidatus Kuenenia stuttgartiensis]MCF6151321.1 chemotaxis protein CheA [Candidatus Kuenenia stuttgartiensis]MCL4727337.1 chemotaxis protein CheA [Candidatus Kuenenia stuttgartiensis]